jgi:LCP family protein required for cell wall assembly
VVGTDARSADIADALGISGVRTDTIMLVSINADTHTVEIESIARDTWVPAPGGRMTRINALFDPADPSTLVDAVSHVTHIAINHYIQLDFEGFIAIADQLGGIDLNFPTAASDASTGFVTAGGCQHLAGDVLLAYSRSRHIRVGVGTESRQDPTGDFGRIARQQDLIVRALRLLGRADASDIPWFVDILAAHAVIDEGASVKALMRVALELRRSAGAVAVTNLPVRPDVIEGSSVLVPVPSGSDATQIDEADVFMPSGDCNTASR